MKAIQKLFPLYLVVFIDGMGLGIIFPILNSVLNSPHSRFYQHLPSTHFSAILYAAVLGVFWLSWFFGATLMGDLSDMWGRKKTLLIALIGQALGYLLLVVAIFTHSLLLLLLSRFIAGLTSGSQPIAQAAIVDASQEADKTRRIGYVLMALSIGMIAGPMIGGALTNHHWVSWFNLYTPLIASTLLSIFNFILLWILFHEITAPSSKNEKFHVLKPIKLFAEAFSDKKIRYLSLIFMCYILGWALFYSYSTGFVMHAFGYQLSMQSLYMGGAIGLGMVLSFGVINPWISKKLSKPRCILLGICIASCLLLMIGLFHSSLIAWLGGIILTASGAMAYAQTIALYSEIADPEHQGRIMGISSSVLALGFAISSVLGAWLETINFSAPLLCAAGLMALGVLLGWRYWKNLNAKVT